MEKGTERLAARPYQSRLVSKHGPDLRRVFIADAQNVRAGGRLD